MSNGRCIAHCSVARINTFWREGDSGWVAMRICGLLVEAGTGQDATNTVNSPNYGTAHDRTRPDSNAEMRTPPGELPSTDLLRRIAGTIIRAGSERPHLNRLTHGEDACAPLLTTDV